MVFRTADQVALHRQHVQQQKAKASNRRHTAKQRASRLLRYVSWANTKAIKAMYELAEWMTEKTGIKHEVDHDIPLLGKHVSGLHVETNLRVVPQEINRKKSNHYEIVMVGGAGFEPATPTV